MNGIRKMKVVASDRLTKAEVTRRKKRLAALRRDMERTQSEATLDPVALLKNRKNTFAGRSHKRCPTCKSKLNAWKAPFGQRRLLCSKCGWNDMTKGTMNIRWLKAIRNGLKGLRKQRTR